jgi:hypothetical protein
MSQRDRAAQFAPFAALVGYDNAVRETACETNEKFTLSEEQKSEINMKLNLLSEHLDEHPDVQITYFLPDKRKSGGEYVTATGCIEKIDEFERMVVIQGKCVPVSDIFEISDGFIGLFESEKE